MSNNYPKITEAIKELNPSYEMFKDFLFIVEHDDFFKVPKEETAFALEPPKCLKVIQPEQSFDPNDQTVIDRYFFSYKVMQNLEQFSKEAIKAVMGHFYSQVLINLYKNFNLERYTVTFKLPQSPQSSPNYFRLLDDPIGVEFRVALIPHSLKDST